MLEPRAPSEGMPHVTEVGCMCSSPAGMWLSTHTERPKGSSAVGASSPSSPEAGDMSYLPTLPGEGKVSITQGLQVVSG